jgi:hypothetical protein
MISGILRIFFWFAEGYAINLLFQAFFIIIIQVLEVVSLGVSIEGMYRTAKNLRMKTDHNHFGDGIPLTNTVNVL